MPPEDLLLSLAVVVGPLLLLAALAVLIRKPRIVWASTMGGVLGLLMVASFVGFWIAWGRGFDYADANRPVPLSIDRAMNACFVLFVVFYSAFLVTALATFIQTRARRREAVQESRG
jgi:hypothetical protein